jgi:hypothetical protein
MYKKWERNGRERGKMATGRKEPCWSTKCAIAYYTLIYQQLYKGETKEIKNYESCIISISNHRKT